ncbi:sulfur carrier protein ThiS [uncultured Bacteroides sp.]|uniref:sulfur carrier protein ThiS n=1 Tax=uncultured Bacteroides sp. TaxID=162156 RepID=UPI002AABC16F|nr:sulfur carrier protein ThiS [uncultured Bacteroides sp.]
MKVQVNNKEIEIHSSTTITQLTEKLEIPSVGSAIAVNNQLISRSQWASHSLKENDDIVIIQAACGG